MYKLKNFEFLLRDYSDEEKKKNNKKIYNCILIKIVSLRFFPTASLQSNFDNSENEIPGIIIVRDVWETATSVQLHRRQLLEGINDFYDSLFSCAHTSIL